MSVPSDTHYFFVFIRYRGHCDGFVIAFDPKTHGQVNKVIGMSVQRNPIGDQFFILGF